MRHWLRWLLSANYRREVAWRKNPYRWLVERQKMGIDEGTEIYIPYIKGPISEGKESHILYLEDVSILESSEH